jgi:hypothetical protein
MSASSFAAGLSVTLGVSFCAISRLPMLGCAQTSQATFARAAPGTPVAAPASDANSASKERSKPNPLIDESDFCGSEHPLILREEAKQRFSEQLKQVNLPGRSCEETCTALRALVDAYQEVCARDDSNPRKACANAERLQLRASERVRVKCPNCTASDEIKPHVP